MNQSNTELLSAMKEVLETVKQGKEIKTIFPNYPDTKAMVLVEAINTCLAEGYLNGISCDVGSHDDITINTPCPHVTAAGLRFISEN